MKTLAERLNYAMRKARMSQGALSNAVGVSQPSIWKLASGKTDSSRKLVQIAHVLGVRPEWLASGEGAVYASENLEMFDSDESQEEPNKHQCSETGNPGAVSTWDGGTPLDNDEVEVPFLKDIELACGDGSYSEGDYNGYKLRFAKATLRRVGANSDGTGVLCFPARGNSMEPFIPDGTTVAVNTNDKRVVDGKIYAINQDGWKRLKLLYRTGANAITIRSFNAQEFPDEVVGLSDIEVLGRVFWYSVLL